MLPRCSPESNLKSLGSLRPKFLVASKAALSPLHLGRWSNFLLYLNFKDKLMACACGLAFWDVSYWRLYLKKKSLDPWLKQNLCISDSACVGLWFMFLCFQSIPVLFSFIKLLTEVFVELHLLQSPKSPFHCEGFTLVLGLLMFSVPPPTLRSRQAPCKYTGKTAPFSPAERLLLLCHRVYCDFSHSFPFLVSCTCPGAGERRSHSWTMRACKTWYLEIMSGTW